MRVQDRLCNVLRCQDLLRPSHPLTSFCPVRRTMEIGSPKGVNVHGEQVSFWIVGI